MSRGTSPATIVLLSGVSARSRRVGAGDGEVPISWVADQEHIATAPDSAALVAELPAACFASRQALRDAIHRIRQRHPALATVLVRDVPLQHRGVLAEAGIRVALVETFSDLERGTRRPAPAGWACRSVVWGLWEVQLTPPLHGWRRLLRGTALPAIGPGSLAVVFADDGPSTAGDGRSVAACTAWATRAQTKHAAELALVADLPDLLEHGAAECGPTTCRGSILRAA